MKDFFIRLFFIFKGGDPWLDDDQSIRRKKQINNSIILIDPDPYLYFDE